MPLIALDLDGTLVDQAAAARIWACRFAEDRGLPGPEADVLARALAARRCKDEVFALVAERLGLPGRAEELWRDYRRQMPSLVRVTGEDRQALIGLRAAGWTLGIVTNGMADNQEGKIRRTGLDALVDGWVVSEAVGARKPAPEIFGALAAKLGCALDGWMIGDSLDADVAGGVAVGLWTAWVDRDGSGTSGHCPDLIVNSVAMAARLILDGEVPGPVGRQQA